MTVHIHNRDPGSQQHVTQREPPLREVTTKTFQFISHKCWITNTVRELMKPLPSEFLYSSWIRSHKKSIYVPFGFVNLVPGMLAQVPHKAQSLYDILH